MTKRVVSVNAFGSLADHVEPLGLLLAESPSSDKRESEKSEAPNETRGGHGHVRIDLLESDLV